MQLTLFSDYALRTLLFLGVHRDRLVSVPQIARAYGISEHHLVKVARLLVRLGLVEAVRGRGGGMRLSKPPEQIPLGELIRRTEPHLNLLDCFDPARNSCPIAAACRLKSALHEAQDAFMAVLDRYSLADLLTEPAELIARWKA